MRSFLMVSALALLSACATVGKPVDLAAVKGFTPGVTTIQQAEATLGAPSQTTNLSDGSTYLTYSYAHAQSYIVGGKTASQFAQLVFDPSGKFVRSITSDGSTVTAAGN